MVPADLLTVGALLDPPLSTVDGREGAVVVLWVTFLVVDRVPVVHLGEVRTNNSVDGFTVFGLLYRFLVG